LQPRIKNLRHHIVKKLAGVFVLCTFLLSITPKQVIHNLVADHKDVSSHKTNDRLQFNAASYNCDCNYIVSTSAYLGAAQNPDQLNFKPLFSFDINRSFALVTTIQANINLRGPPTVKRFSISHGS
jgi:hypothetical protein